MTRSGERGRFIVFEGPEGAGKSLQCGRLRTALEQAGRTVISTREPGGTALGEALRRHLWQDPELEIGGLAELFLLSAARAALVEDVIRPALVRGEWVISDRYALSTRVYQGHARGVDVERIDRVTRLATSGLEPDLTLVLDVPPETGRARQSAAGDVPDRIEREGLDFMRRVREGYRACAAGNDAIVLVDGDRTPDAVAADVWRRVEERLAP